MRLFLSALLVLLLAQCSPNEAAPSNKAGPARADEVGNGGDAYALEFTYLGRSVAKALLAERFKIAGVSAASFNTAVETTRVQTLERVFLSETPRRKRQEVAASNYRKLKKILLSRTRWKGYTPWLKLSLVVHEYLGIIGKRDGGYEISTQFLASTPQIPAEALESLILQEIESKTCSRDRYRHCVRNDYRLSFGSIECDQEARSCDLHIERAKFLRSPPSISTLTLDSVPVTSGKYLASVINCPLPSAELPEMVEMESDPLREPKLKIRPEVLKTILDCLDRLH